MSRNEKSVVLLVDDNEATCTLVAAILHREFEVEVASDGGEAIEKLKTKEYAAVLLDLRMPGIDGYDVLAFLKEHRPDVLRRVLVLTASLSPNELARVKDHEICGVIAKPFEIEAVLAGVKQCAGGEGFTRFFSSGMILLLAEVLRAGFRN
ncbi:MAG TPA: response regulator [Thermoanaerobaculia bacterium]|jgi:CheY-like chemotaxis protein